MKLEACSIIDKKQLMKIGIIYKATNKINGKCYIGQTYQNFGDRKSDHLYNAFNIKDRHYNCYFYNAIRKYGKDIWIWEIICEEIRIKDLNEYEKWYIGFYCSFGSNGYNSDSGGNNGRIISIEARKKMSASQKGKHLSEETKKKMSLSRSGDKSYAFGKHPSEESRKKMSEARKGRIISPEARKKSSITHKKRIFSKKYIALFNLYSEDKLSENSYSSIGGNMICVWNMGDECSADVEEKSLFNNQITVNICGNHFKQHETIMKLHELGYDIEEVLQMSAEDRSKELELAQKNE